MDDLATRLRQEAAQLRALNEAAGQAVKDLLALASRTDGPDQEVAELLLGPIEEIGHSAQARQGELVLLLAQAERIKTNRGGLAPWVSEHLDVTEGGARGIAQSAREIGHIPELAEPLASGRIGTTTIRSLTRTAHAAKDTDLDLAETLTATLTLATEHGPGAANKHVRILEETLHPGTAGATLEQQRSRSFLRTAPCESGMYRIDALLDAARATEFKAVLDQTVAAWLRARQYDHTEHAGPDTSTTEQLQAHALVKFAHVFATATPTQRGAEFTPATIYHAPLDPTTDAGLIETAYGDQLPRTILTPPEKNPTTHTEHDKQPPAPPGQESATAPATPARHEKN